LRNLLRIKQTNASTINIIKAIEPYLPPSSNKGVKNTFGIKTPPSVPEKPYKRLLIIFC